MPSPAELPAIALIGGTGPEGRGLAARLARAGYPIIIGSRSEARAGEVAAEVLAVAGDARISGQENAPAAAAAEVLILTVPYSGIGHATKAVSGGSSGKIVVSAIAPVEWVEGRPRALRPEAGSAAQEVQAALPEAKVVSAFQVVDAHELFDLERELDTDILVCSDDQEARRAVMRIARAIPGVRAISGGRLANSRHVEEITPLLIALNRIYKVHSGVRFTGINV